MGCIHTGDEFSRALHPCGVHPPSTGRRFYPASVSPIGRSRLCAANAVTTTTWEEPRHAGGVGRRCCHAARAAAPRTPSALVLCAQCASPARDWAELGKQDTVERRQLTVLFCDLVGATPALPGGSDSRTGTPSSRSSRRLQHGGARSRRIRGPASGRRILAFGYPAAFDDSPARGCRRHWGSLPPARCCGSDTRRLALRPRGRAHRAGGTGQHWRRLEVWPWETLPLGRRVQEAARPALLSSRKTPTA